MKKMKQSKTVRTRLAEKRHKRRLHSKAKKLHRQGTGFRDLESGS